MNRENRVMVLLQEYIMHDKNANPIGTQTEITAIPDEVFSYEFAIRHTLTAISTMPM